MVSAVFEAEGAAEKPLAGILEANGLDESDDGSLILRREIATRRQGARVREQSAGDGGGVAAAGAASGDHPCAERIDSVVRRAGAAGVAGCVCGEPTGSSRDGVRGVEGNSHAHRKNWSSGEQDRLRLVDLWIFQKREIEEGRLQSGEDERLEGEKRVLANAEKIYNAAMNAFDLLYEGNGSTASSLRAAQKQVEELARYEPKFQEALAALETARISVEDVGATVRDYAGGIHASPEHLAQVEDRLALLDRLKRKYGPTLDEVISFGADVSRKLSEVENKDEILREIAGGTGEGGRRSICGRRGRFRRNGRRRRGGWRSWSRPRSTIWR